MKLDLNRVRANVSRADTVDLLDRATVYREGMEPEALELIESELASRGFGPAELDRHRARQSEVLVDRHGYARKCSFCTAPALVQGWGWFCLWEKLPIVPWYFRYCRDHLPPI
jgi:hypothetical protein